MPDLRCTVQTCTHNQNYYCNLDSIVVGGNSAKKADDCMYNKECQCHAGKISVEGGNACHCQETECATFKCGCA